MTSTPTNSGGGTLNWHLGLLRLWLAASVVWVIAAVVWLPPHVTSPEAFTRAPTASEINRCSPMKWKPKECYNDVYVFEKKPWDVATYVNFAGLVAAPVLVSLALGLIAIWVKDGFRNRGA